MGKKIIYLVVLILFISSSLGCLKDGVQKEIKEDLFITSMENFNLTIYKNLSNASYIVFNLITSEAIDENSFSISLDIDTPYSFSLEKMEINEYPQYIYMTYKGIDWDEFYRLERLIEENKGNIEKILKHSQELEDYKKKYLVDYETEKTNPAYKNLNYYAVYIKFSMDDEKVRGFTGKEKIEEVIFSVGEKEYKFPIGKIILDYQTHFETAFYLESFVLGFSEKKLIPNSLGVIVIDNMEFLATENLTIKDIRLLNEGVDIDQIKVILEKDGIALDTIFDQELSLEKGTKFSPTLIVKDKSFMNKQFYYTTLVVEIEYEYMGNVYYQYFTANYMPGADFHELYSIKVHDLDFISYYNKYLNYFGLGD
ncbi:hypothetical protein [Anaerobranca gottschalkii]|uniref:Uncharacterized protein n=1 Tax=Anaerobranca gottschalkii DSM 13577 TaxID=1120990 RepID=A0A1H9ZXZ6_9FIRM|nr:hypothetical protein [Anaerobranca gottschalkii]SES86221.1 hypothetical protein SAMN03080614_101421 [Anaerobranca gottschalkii DSM 13577]